MVERAGKVIGLVTVTTVFKQITGELWGALGILSDRVHTDPL